MHPAAAHGSRGAGLQLGLAGGEDYELCFAAAEGAVESAADEFRAAFGVPITRVGTVEEGIGVWIRDAEGRVAPLDMHGYQHFGEGTV